MSAAARGNLDAVLSSERNSLLHVASGLHGDAAGLELSKRESKRLFAPA